MELVNRSGFPTQAFAATDKHGREHLVIVAKATYRLLGGRTPELSDVQRPIEVADSFTGQPGVSAPIYEGDLVPRKPRCDVIANAVAHAPGDRAVTELPVAIRVGDFVKQFLVIGDRHWRRGALGPSASAPKPFTSMPLHYGRAFGGSPAPVAAYDANPIGVGFFPDPNAGAIDGMPLPNTEDYRAPVTAPNGSYSPLAFGPIGRSWTPRRRFAGTYDAAWRENVFPLLPDDFDEAFFQAAPPDQQMPYPKGGEQIALQNLVPGEPLVTFELPQTGMLAKVLHRSHEVTELSPVVDTLFFDPDERLFSIVYRTSLLLDRQRIFGVKLVAAGPVCKKWWAAQVFGLEDCGCNGEGTGDDDAPPSSEQPGATAEAEPS